MLTRQANRVWVKTSTVGTGALTLGAAEVGYQTFAAGGLVTGDVVNYTISDGSAWEVGRGTYSSVGPTLARSVRESSNADALLVLSGGATVFVTPIAVGGVFDAAGVLVTLATVAELQATSVSTAIDVIEVAGFYDVGDGGGSRYKRVGSEPLHSVWRQSADGAYWVPLPGSDGGISVLANGAIADGNALMPDTGGDTTIGTDNYQVIQDLVDAHTYFLICDHVYFPRGAYKISSTIQCGYGVSGPPDAQFTYVTTHLRGSGGATGQNTDSALICDFDDKPGLIFQGQRYSSLFGLVIWGKQYTWINGESLGFFPDVDDTDPLNWNDPNATAKGASRTSPYAGIAVDPCSGGDPSRGINTLTWSAGTVTVTTSSDHGIKPPKTFPVIVQFATPTGYNVTNVTATSTGADTFTYPVAVNPGPMIDSGEYTMGFYNLPIPKFIGWPVTSMSWSGGTVTVQDTGANGFATGDIWQGAFVGAVPTGYNGTYTMTQTGATTFTYPLAIDPGVNTTTGRYNWTYDRAHSSMMILDQCSINGFDTAYVVKPGNGDGADGNADFHGIYNSQFANCKYGISVGHTQCRNVNRINCGFFVMYCVDTTSTHGNINGKMDGISLGCSLGQVMNIHIFENDLSISGPHRYEKLYGEDVWRFGTINTSTQVSGSISYVDSDIGFFNQDPDEWRGVPAYMLETLSGIAAEVKFSGGGFGNYYSVFAINAGFNQARGEPNSVTIDGTQFLADNFGIKDTLWERAAQNVLAGGLAFGPAPDVVNGAMRIRAFLYDLDEPVINDARSAVTIGPAWQPSQRGRPVCLYSINAINFGGRQDSISPTPFMAAFLDLTAATSASLTSRELKFTYQPSQYESMRWGPRVGDVLLYQDNGAVFYVRDLSIAGPDFTVKATMQNNFKPTADFALTSLTWLAGVVTATTTAPHGITVGREFRVTVSGAMPDDYNGSQGSILATSTGLSAFTYALTSNPGGPASVPGFYWTFVEREAITVASDNWRVINSRIYTPDSPLIGTITSASASVTNAGSPDGNTGADDVGINEGDWYLVTDSTWELPFPVDSDNVVVAASLTATGFTLGDVANYTEDRHHFRFFIKPSPDP